MTSPNLVPPPTPLPAIILASLLLLAAAAGGFLTIQQRQLAPSTPIPPEALMAQNHPPLRGVQSSATQTSDGPGWETLTTKQKLVLYPLAPRWQFLSLVQKRRWLALADSFSDMSMPEQSKLHSRMLEWASLSAQQRTQARVNYAKTNRLPLAEKRAQWEAYQSLSEEQKKQLAASATPNPKGAATTLKTVVSKKLIQIPATNSGLQRPNVPKIPSATRPGQTNTASGWSASTPATTSNGPQNNKAAILEKPIVSAPPTSTDTIVTTSPIALPSAVANELPSLPQPAESVKAPDNMKSAP